MALAGGDVLLRDPPGDEKQQEYRETETHQNFCDDRRPKRLCHQRRCND